MIEPLVGVLVVIILVVAVLVYLEAIDVGDMIVGLFQLVWLVVKLIAGGLFALGAFFVWLVMRNSREKKAASEQPRDC
jgi:hypothetical protein